MLSTRDRILCSTYGLIAVIALVATWWNNVAYLRSEGAGSFMGFLRAGYVNYATTSLTNDLLLVVLTAFVFMVVEARRLGIRHMWVYLLASIVVAISVALPVFLIARQIGLARRDSNGQWPDREADPR